MFPVVGMTTKLCGYCRKETPHTARESNGMLIWVCQNPEHVAHRILSQETARDIGRYTVPILS